MEAKTHNSRRLIFAVLSITLFLLLSGMALAVEEDSEDLLGMSLDQLMDVEVYVPASLTEKNPYKTPASVTIITSEDIARTPARNILDLMEVYVPGAMWMNHSAGPLPGIRGILVDRPYKFLVNVNGVNLNIKTYFFRIRKVICMIVCSIIIFQSRHTFSSYKQRSICPIWSVRSMLCYPV